MLQPPTPPSPVRSKETGTGGRWRAAALAIAVVVMVAVFASNPQQSLAAIREGLGQLGPWAPVLFILVYVAACVLLIPGSALTLGAGALFGIIQGSVLVSIGATLGATAAFLIGRHLARNWIEQRLRRYPQFNAVQDAVAREGWKIVLLTRLSPAFPFSLLNYAFGLTRVSLRDYVLASWIGMLPGTVLYVYLGSVSGAVLEAAAGGPRQTTRAEWWLAGVGLLAALAVTAYITRIARRALQQRIPPS